MGGGGISKVSVVKKSRKVTTKWNSNLLNGCWVSKNRWWIRFDVLGKTSNPLLNKRDVDK